MCEIILVKNGCELKITKYIMQYDAMGGLKNTDVEVSVRFDIKYNDTTTEHFSMGLKRANALSMFLDIPYGAWLDFVADKTDIMPIEA